MACALDPADVLQSSEGKTRFVRLARLLVCGGTTVMRELFDYLIPPANLAAVLSSPAIKTRLTDMRNKKILSSPQWQKLYPPSGLGSVQSTSFDITLLFKLLRENMISGLSAPSRGWDDLPNIGDLSLPADMARMKYYRNGIAHVDEKMELSEQEFSDYWKEINDALMRIVGQYAKSGSSKVKDWEMAIDRLLTDPLTEDDRKNVEELKSWYLDERDLKEMVDHVRLLLESSKNDGKVFSAKFVTKATTFGAWLGGNIYILHRLKNHPDLLIDYVKYGVIPTGILVCCVAFGSINLTLKPETLDALDEFWKRYESGQLKNDFENVMITEELKNLANGRKIEVSVEVNERQFEETRKRLAEEEASEAVRSLCVLPPKPSHEIVDRSEDVRSLLEEMKRLRKENNNDIAVVYLSGNPGCGKSEIARQIGQKFFLPDVTKETSDLKLVFTFDASSLDTLIHSYTEFARALRCPKDSIAVILKTENTSSVLKVLQLKCLVTSKLKNYSSWLMIVDNVTDLELVSRYFLQKKEKSSGNGYILVTTQDGQCIEQNYYHLSLSAGMKPDEAIRMLTCISMFPSEKDIALEVAKELDFQPLAMACAAVYMRRTTRMESAMTWARFLEQMKSSEQEEAEKSARMKTAVMMAVEKEMRDENMRHVFHFLSMLATKPLPIEYVIHYVTNCIPEKEKESVAASICTCSLLVKETGVHEVVHDCLQTLILNRKEENEVADFKVVETFSSCLTSYESYESQLSSNFILDTGTLVVHLLALAERLKHFLQHDSQLIRKVSNRHAVTSNALLVIGIICLTHGKHDAAKIYLEMCLMIQDTFYSKNYLPLALTLNHLGKALCGIKHFEEANNCFERALTIEEMAYSKEHPALIKTLTNIGNTFRDLGFAEKARQYFQRALKIEEITYGKQHPGLLNNIGATLLDLGLQNEAKRCFERALTLAAIESERNEVALIKAHALVNLGDICSELGNYDESKIFFERALNIYEMICNEYHPSVVATLNKLGNILRDVGEYQQAEKCLERVLSIDEQVYPLDHPVFASTFNNLGNTYRDLGKYTEAKRCFERALSILKTTYDENHPLIASTLCNLSLALRDLGQLKEAKICLESALTIQETFLGESHPILIAIFTNVGINLCDLGQVKEAKKWFEKAIAMSETVYGEDHQILTVALKNLALIYLC